MGWILSCIDRLRMTYEPSPPDATRSVLGEEAFPVAMMPLGTGEMSARGGGARESSGFFRYRILMRCCARDVSLLFEEKKNQQHGETIKRTTAKAMTRQDENTFERNDL